MLVTSIVINDPIMLVDILALITLIPVPITDPCCCSIIAKLVKISIFVTSILTIGSGWGFTIVSYLVIIWTSVILTSPVCLTIDTEICSVIPVFVSAIILISEVEVSSIDSIVWIAVVNISGNCVSITVIATVTFLLIF